MNVRVHVDDERGDVIAPAWLWEICSQDETRFAICSPWSEGEWSYATDGRMLVRMPRLAGVPANRLAPKNIPTVLGWSEMPAVEQWWTLEEIELAPMTSDCDECESASRQQFPVEFGPLLLRNDLVSRMAGMPGAQWAVEPGRGERDGRCLVRGDHGAMGIIMGMHEPVLLPRRATWVEVTGGRES